MLQRLSTPMTIILKLTQALSDSLSALGFPEQDIKLSPPNNPDFGDLSSNLALTLAKDLQKNPIQIANPLLHLDFSILRLVKTIIMKL